MAAVVTADLKLLVESRLAGSIIGKGGSTLRAIKERSGARHIQLSQVSAAGAVDRTVCVTGLRDSIEKAFALIAEVLRAEAGTITSSTAASESVRLLVPNAVAGMLIGGAGAGVRRLREGSGAAVDVAKQSGPAYPKERQITCVGTPPQTERAVALLVEAIAEREHGRHHGFLSQWEFETNFNDHFETPRVAYEDVLPLLESIARQSRQSADRSAEPEEAASRKRKRAKGEHGAGERVGGAASSSASEELTELTVYDPYFCKGNMCDRARS